MGDPVAIVLTRLVTMNDGEELAGRTAYNTNSASLLPVWVPRGEHRSNVTCYMPVPPV